MTKNNKQTSREHLRNERVIPDSLTDTTPDLIKKNTLIIISDQHNPFISSPYGHPFVQTPNLQWLADEGTLFENAYTPCPPCLPARTSFLTGLRGHQAGVYTNNLLGIRHDFPNYGSVLSAQGVYTTHIGILYSYNLGENLGFSEVLYPQDRKPPENMADKSCRLERKPHTKPLQLRYVDEDSLITSEEYGVKKDPRSLRDKKITRLAIKWLKEKGATLDQPWVLTTGLFKPHNPYVTSKQELWDMYAGRGDLPRKGEEAQTANHPYSLDLRSHQGKMYSKEALKQSRRGYYARVTELDQDVGRIIETLKELNLLQDTNIIYTSDHGDMLGEFGLWSKSILLEDAARIPMIACGPDFPKNTRVKTPVDLHDLQASIFETCGGIRPGEWTGTPLQNISHDDKHRVIFAEYHGPGLRAGSFMIRKGNWKLIYCFNASHQLFNLEKDSDELENIYAQHPQKAEEMEDELRKICNPELENEKAFNFYGDSQTNDPEYSR